MSIAENGQKYLSRKATAEYSGLSVRMVDKMAVAKLLPAIRVGRRVMFDRADIDAFMALQKS